MWGRSMAAVLFVVIFAAMLLATNIIGELGGLVIFLAWRGALPSNEDEPE